MQQADETTFNQALNIAFDNRLGLCQLASEREVFPLTGRYARQFAAHRLALVGDAAHPVAQYMAQGACMALEDAVTLGKALQQCDGDAADAFALYESVRIPRTARIVWSTREMGRVYHAAGVERQVRNLLWKDKSQAEFYRGMEWLYGWKEDNCLLPR